MFALLFASLMVPQPAASDPPARPVPASNPRVIEPFEQDWVLMDWALRFHDEDGNVRLSLAEAEAAAAAFKTMADHDKDGRLTPYEYDRAREFLIARY